MKFAPFKPCTVYTAKACKGGNTKVVIMLKAMVFYELLNQKFKSWARKRPAISECKLRLKKVVIGRYFFLNRVKPYLVFLLS